MKRRDLLRLAPALGGALMPGPGQSQSAATELLTLELNGWPALRRALAGRRAIVHLWGLTCAPCIEELSRWAAFIERRPQAPIVLIEVEPADPARIQATLRRAGVNGGRQYVVQGFPDERWRYAVDPRWGGELPRTLLLEATGAMRAFSGAADFAALQRWLQP
ncbi:MAG: hypothetical protein QM750_11145 [Rubrivivax sp.]